VEIFEQWEYENITSVSGASFSLKEIYQQNIAVFHEVEQIAHHVSKIFTSKTMIYRKRSTSKE